MKILLTGANGFIGSALHQNLISHGYDVVPTIRNNPTSFDQVVVGDINDATFWGNALSGCDMVIHAAGRAHIMSEKVKNPLNEYQKINTFGTLNLARQAVKAGIKRFIFISSIKVNGEFTMPPSIFNSDDLPSPADPYGESKMEAEISLNKLSIESGMEVVIIRPPLVYGVGVKGNFLDMIHFVKRGVPLPLKAISQNKRSIVGVDNFIDLIRICLQKPEAANKTFLISDGKDLSTREIFEKLNFAFNRPQNLFYCPVALIKLLGIISGNKKKVDRLLGSMQVDMKRTCEILDWVPPFTTEEGFLKLAMYYK
jgi:nucleoside-diphosphate-sugar epimerase